MGGRRCTRSAAWLFSHEAREILVFANCVRPGRPGCVSRHKFPAPECARRKPRLTECAAILAGQQGRSAEQIFGGLDAQKLRSCITLFLHAAPGEPVFRQVLDQYFGGLPDPATEQRIETR